MPILDRGKRGLRVERQPLVLGPGSYLDPCAAGPHLFEDFIGPIGATLADSSRISVAQSGTATTTAALSGTAGAPVAGHGGWIAGSVDNVDNEIDEIALGDAPWLVPAALPAGGLIVAEIGFVVPVALTARMYFAGLSDAATGGADDDGPISIVTGTTTVSGVTADGVGFLMSSLATDADAWYAVASKATTAGTAFNTTSGTGASAGPAVVDKYTKLRVEVDVDGDCYFYVVVDGGSNGRDQITPVYQQAQAAAVTAATALLPIFTAASTTTTAVEWEIDYIFGAATHG